MVSIRVPLYQLLARKIVPVTFFYVAAARVVPRNMEIGCVGLIAPLLVG
jgi:hypothetical protein